MYTLFRETYLSVTSRFFSNNTCWNERLITPSGLVFVGQILGKSSFVKKSTVLLTYIGMLCQGKPQYEAVREMIDDPDYYKYALGISYAIPSAETLRQRFDMIGDSLRKDIQQANVDMLREMHIEPTALDSGNDASENIGIFMEESYKYNNVSFIIKRNPRQESKKKNGRDPSGNAARISSIHVIGKLFISDRPSGM